MMLTTIGRRLAEFGRSVLGRPLFRVRKATPGETGPPLTSAADLRYFGLKYLRTCWQEFRNLSSRRKILRNRRLCLTGVDLLSLSESVQLSPHDRSRLIRARRICI